MFRLEGVCFRYPDGVVDAVREVTLRVSAGRHTQLVGPNGAGKSTLFRLMLGRLRPSRGRIELAGRELAAWRARELARRVGVVAPERPPDFPITVREYVEMGRNPYLRPWAALRAADRSAVRSALARVDLEDFADRDVGSLSDGERQRARLARALAQEPEVLLLDEPGAHLDLGHEMQMQALLGGLVRETGMTAVSITHNLNLASRFGDALALLSGGRLVAEGTPREVLTAERVEEAFGWPVRIVDLGELGLQVVPRGRQPA